VSSELGVVLVVNECEAIRGGAFLCLFHDLTDFRPKCANIVLHGASGVDGEYYVDIASCVLRLATEGGNSYLLSDEFRYLCVPRNVRVVELVCVVTNFRFDMTIVFGFSFGLKKLVDPPLRVSIP